MVPATTFSTLLVLLSYGTLIRVSYTLIMRFGKYDSCAGGSWLFL